MRTRQASGQVRLRWRCGWMFLSVPQTCPSPPSLINCLSLNSRFELASRHRRNPAIDWTEIPPKESSEICLYASGGKVNCYQRGRGRFWSSCDISATKLEPELASCGMLETDEKTKLIKMLNGYRRPPAGFLRQTAKCVLRAGGPGGLAN